MKKSFIVLMMFFVLGRAWASSGEDKELCTTFDKSFYSLSSASILADRPDWYTTSSSGDSGNYVRGIAFCSTSKNYPSADLGSFTSFDSNKLYCFCKMAVPVVSAWKYMNGYSNQAECNSGCANYCSQNAATLFDDTFISY